MTLHARVLLPYGLVAEIEVSDEERGPYVPSTDPPAPHSTYCNCVTCVVTRTRERDQRDPR